MFFHNIHIQGYSQNHRVIAENLSQLNIYLVNK